jgi:homoserine O-acetyltransferase
VVPTWLLGRSEDWLPLLGQTGIIDTTRFQVLVLDALADGLSSSPSNTEPASRRAFDSLTIGDMVMAQYQLLRDLLGLSHVHAIVGISMGGMQALEWGVRYPRFASRIVPMMGSPRVPAHDQLMWTAMLREIEDARRAGISSDTVWARLAQLEMLFLQTPGGLNARGADSVQREVATNAARYRGGWALEDYAAQLRAISRHDISRPFGGDMERAAQVMRARMLAVYSWDDQMVTAGPMAAFARRIRADTLALRSPCGHITFVCEKARIGKTVRAFLAQ